MTEKELFTSESVTEGHPDKLCDQISDAVLDACLAQDPESRVACETLAKNSLILIAGEVTTRANVDFSEVARQTIKGIGYTKTSQGLAWDSCDILVHMTRQSPDISVGVTASESKEQGAGDQGLMFGYACNETPEFMPLPIHLAHRLAEQLARVRKDPSSGLQYLGPDGKSQVTVEYRNGKPFRLETVVISNQHEADVPQDFLRAQVLEYVIKPIVGDIIDTNVYINPTGSFVLGGPRADAGLTGRKIIVDTYGGMGRHGGGAFSGKDPSKVDRSAAYAARYIAKNIVAANLADRCEVQLAYAIGIAEPISVYVNTFGTGRVPTKSLTRLVRDHFPLKPGDIIRELDLKRPIYQKTAAYGHFGREDPDFTWERTDKADMLRTAAEGSHSHQEIDLGGEG